MSNKKKRKTKVRYKTFKKVDFESWLNDVEIIINNINMAVNNINRIKSPKNEEEKRVVSNEFFQNYLSQNVYIAIIEFDKLLSSSKIQHLSFEKLFNKLINSAYSHDMQKLFRRNNEVEGRFKDRKDMLGTINAIKAEKEKLKRTCETINTLRNKTFAHTDLDRKKEVLKLKDLNEISAFVKNSFKTMKEVFFCSYSEIENNSMNVGSIINIISASLKD